jgi:hypothetical protein
MTSTTVERPVEEAHAEPVTDEGSDEGHEADRDDERPDLSVAVETDAVTRATVDLRRAEALRPTAEAHETAAHQALRDAQEGRISAAIRRRAVRASVRALGGIRADDPLVAEVEAGARAAAGRVAQARARLAGASRAVTHARGGHQTARQSW